MKLFERKTFCIILQIKQSLSRAHRITAQLYYLALRCQGREVPGYSIDWVSWSAYPWPASSTHHSLQLCKHYLRWQPATSYLILPGFIHLNHHEWDGILRTLKSYTGKNSIMSSSEDDREHLKQDMKETVRILDECLKVARNPSIGINHVCGYKSSNPWSTEYFPIAIDEFQPSKWWHALKAFTRVILRFVQISTGYNVQILRYQETQRSARFIMPVMRLPE